jgi:hypothetical protein
MTLFRPLSAFVTAVVAGIAENLFDKETDPAERENPSCGCGTEVPTTGASPTARLREGFRFAFRDLLGDLAPWLAVGFPLETATLRSGCGAGGPLLAEGRCRRFCRTAKAHVPQGRPQGEAHGWAE